MFHDDDFGDNHEEEPEKKEGFFGRMLHFLFPKKKESGGESAKDMPKVPSVPEKKGAKSELLKNQSTFL